MKILLIASSPRINGNSDILADAFTKGALSAGNRVTNIHLASLRIQPCSACDMCASNGTEHGLCVQNDDMEKLYQMILEHDLIAFAMPLYFYTFPGKLKAVLDRFYAFYQHGGYPKRESVLLVTAADDAPDTFDAVKLTYEKILAHLEWNSRGMVFVPGVHAKGDIENKPDSLNEAEQLGAALR